VFTDHVPIESAPCPTESAVAKLARELVAINPEPHQA
jgi:hypothetical protein